MLLDCLKAARPQSGVLHLEAAPELTCSAISDHAAIKRASNTYKYMMFLYLAGCMVLVTFSGVQTARGFQIKVTTPGLTLMLVQCECSCECDSPRETLMCRLCLQHLK